MFKHTNKILDKSVKAIDGNIGFIRELYFDINDLILRYLLVDMENWLTDRKILITPESFRSINWDQGEITINLKRADIENSPIIRLDEPVTRAHEKQLREFYKFPFYWSSQDEVETGSYLISEEEFRMVDVQLIDGKLGKVQDVIVDDDTWKIKFIIVDADAIEVGRRTPIPSDWLDRIDHEANTVYVDLKMENVETAPQFPVEEYEDERNIKALYDYYSRPRYW
ncbi:MAG: hypothetical protein GF315_01030 [candidate division Zixibacteria bacterium]|nr:hypothetical protein [candidate division Zixibacteria bacterium]